MARPDASAFQICMEELEIVAREMWKRGVEGIPLQQSDYLWPMADALEVYEKAIKGTVEEISTPERWEQASSSYDPELSRSLSQRSEK